MRLAKPACEGDEKNIFTDRQTRVIFSSRSSVKEVLQKRRTSNPEGRAEISNESNKYARGAERAVTKSQLEFMGGAIKQGGAKVSAGNATSDWMRDHSESVLKLLLFYMKRLGRG